MSLTQRPGLVLAAGGVALLALWGGGLAWKKGPIERDLASKVEASTRREKFDWVRVSFDGRDATLTGLVRNGAEREQILELVSSIRGVRVVNDAMAVPPEAQPVFRMQKRQDKLLFTGLVAGEDKRLFLREMATMASSGAVEDFAEADYSLPSEDWTEASLFALMILSFAERAEATITPDRIEIEGRAEDPEMAIAAAPPAPEGFEVIIALDNKDESGATTCRAHTEQLLETRRFHFALNSTRLTADSKNLLDSLAGVARQCPDRKILIEGHTDATGADELNYVLSWRRAEAVIEALVLRGVDRARMEARGLGASLPVARNDNESGRARNRRIEIFIR